MPKTRLDLLLVERGLADSRAQAQRLVMAGQVRVDGQVALKSSTSVDTGAELTIEQPPPFVSRGGEKLQAALQEFGVSPQGCTCADVGASTGGFTDCLLQHGAARVYAIDVGQGILHWKLRQDERVVVMEKTNARYLEHLPEPVTLVTIDASFISLKILLPVVRGWFSATPPPSSFSPSPSTITPRPSSFSQGWEKEEGLGENVEGNHLLALVKPQFEAGRKQVARGDGVIRDPQIHRQVLLDVLAYALQDGYIVRGLLRSPLLGPKGNAEFLAWLSYCIPQTPAGPEDPVPAEPMGDLEALVERIVPLAPQPPAEPTQP
jgi:23S rRNA (cytidine1920-2'-O)/16S rRNA (cytidine1409-2'-O)-methyltransferase